MAFWTSKKVGLFEFALCSWALIILKLTGGPYPAKSSSGTYLYCVEIQYVIHHKGRDIQLYNIYLYLPRFFWLVTWNPRAISSSAILRENTSQLCSVVFGTTSYYKPVKMIIYQHRNENPRFKLKIIYIENGEFKPLPAFIAGRMVCQWHPRRHTLKKSTKADVPQRLSLDHWI